MGGPPGNETPYLTVVVVRVAGGLGIALTKWLGHPHQRHPPLLDSRCVRNERGAESQPDALHGASAALPYSTAVAVCASPAGMRAVVAQALDKRLDVPQGHARRYRTRAS